MQSSPTSATASSVDEILITEELQSRPSRETDLAAENRALLALAKELADSPQTILQKLADLARELCRADSAGVSVLEEEGNTPDFRWRAISGPFAGNLGGILPRDASPCGTVLERDATLLFNGPGRFFPVSRTVQPPIFEALLVPFHVDGKVVGTVWALGHQPGKHFEAEDARLLNSLARFASAAYKRTSTEDAVRASRAAALNLIEDAVLAREKTEQVSASLRESEARLAAELDALQRLHELIVRLRGCLDLGPALEEVLVATIEITRADMGVVQRFRPEDEVLEIVAQRGFTQDFLDRFRIVHREGNSACAQAVREGRRVLVEDTQADSAHESCHGADAAAGFRSLQSTPLIDRNGELLGVLSTYYRQPYRPTDRELRVLDLFTRQATDFIERVREEKSLRESQERLRLIVENARDFAIFSMDLDRRVTSWNTGAERILGYSETEILGAVADVIFTPEDRAAGVPEREALTALSDGKASDERWHLRKDGRRFWGNGLMMAMQDASGVAVGLVKIFRDETADWQTRETLAQNERELWEALQEMEEAREQAEVAKTAKDHFLAVLSHELRTPLTPVLMAVRALMADKGLSPKVREALEMIGRNIQIEARFIDDLLDVTRIERGKLELQAETVDLHQVVHRAVEVAAGDIEDKKQKLIVALEAAEHALKGDVMRLQQVFWNLLKNASKFSPEGGEIRLSSRNEGGRIVVAVSDDGIGFGSEAAEHLFEPFAQANVAVTRRFGGLGLGLAIAKAAVDGHGGVLRAESPGPEKGSTFSVELPLAGAEPISYSPTGILP